MTRADTDAVALETEPMAMPDGVVVLDEPVLPDDYPVFGDYLYVADGKVIRSDWHGITVRRLRHELGATEIRRCDIPGRQAAQEKAIAKATGAAP